MACAIPTTVITDEERRWVIIGVCLTKILTPALRNVLATEIPKWHQILCRSPTEIHKQEFGQHKQKLSPSTMSLNYKNINSNGIHNSSAELFDYAVKDPVSLAKLFVQPFMSKFTGFDETMDISAVLSVICKAAPFTAAASHAKEVRSDIRNQWAHCNFANWTEAKFTAAFLCMERLLKNVNLSREEEQQICDQLNGWKDKGLKMCFNQPVDIDISILLNEVQELCSSVQTLNLEREQMSAVLLNINEIQSKLNLEIGDLRRRVEGVEMQAYNHDRRIESLKGEIRYITKKEKLPYVFNAPSRNQYFAGRDEEIEKLKSILKVGETSNEKKVRVAAVCGLGGIGKTSLVTEYAHQMKDFYKGGVYWFSAEDDTFLDKSVNDIALKLQIFAVSYNPPVNSNLSVILMKIGTTNDPCLIVLDCLDQLELSSNMTEFLSFPSHTSICGHFVMITRRNPDRLLNEVSVFDKKSFLQLECFQLEEAKKFLFSRCCVAHDENCVAHDENVDSDVECLCEELGRLPLALEQAGAYIFSTRGCSFSLYLEHYKIERTSLQKQRGLPAAPRKESLERLAVHTTWRINVQHIKKDSNGEEALRFLKACAFFNPNEIEEELINVGKPEVEGVSYRRFVSLPLGSCQILKLLTDFSLFKYVDAHSRSVTTHRLVQELVKDSLDSESKAKSLADAVRMLSYAFDKCSSPSHFVQVNEENDEEQYLAVSDLQHSQFYVWSKLCMHGHNLRRSIEDLLERKICLDPLWFPETAKIFYECAVHLSANRKQKDAKRTLNFGYRILDWLPSEECATIKSDLSNSSLFPLRIPLPKSFQTEINRFCSPPSEQSTPRDDDLDAELRIGKSKTDENKGIEEACDAHSSTVDLISKWKNLSSEDANDELSRFPDCWEVYAGRALGLKDSGENAFAEMAAALAFYHNRDIFSDYPLFKESFLDLQDRIFICNSVDELQEAIYSHKIPDDKLKLLILGSQEYIINVRPTFAQPWNNCFLVGTRRRCPVSLKLDGSIDLLKCILVNLSFYFDNGQLNCMHESVVELLGCNFTSDGAVYMDAVTTQGDLNAGLCNFEYSKGCGLSCREQGSVVVADCSFRGNGKNGLTIKGQNKSKSCVVSNCDIHHNLQNGIDIHEAKCSTYIHENHVYCNGHSGVRIHRSAVEIKENNIFDNDTWGVFSGGNSLCDISMNRIFRNQCGGVRLGYKQEEGETVPTVVEKNEIFDNNGPGFVNNVNNSHSTKYQDNKLSDNVEGENVGKLDFSVPYCSNCHKKSTLSSCGKCFTAAYCNEGCQNDHSQKHGTICEDLREKSSYLITSMETPNTRLLELEGRRFAPLLQDETRFLVQVFNILTRQEVESTIILKDRYLERPQQFNSIAITELVKEFGILRKRKNSEKELFLYCVFEDDSRSQLRLFTNQFAEGIHKGRYNTADRLGQEMVKDDRDPESEAKSFTDAVGIEQELLNVEKLEEKGVSYDKYVPLPLDKSTLLIGPSGGVIKLDDVSLKIEAGCLAGDTEITLVRKRLNLDFAHVESVVELALVDAIPRVVEFFPHSLRFLKPAVLAIRLEKSTSDTELFILHGSFNDKHKKIMWEVMTNDIESDDDEGVFAVKINGFSFYVFIFAMYENLARTLCHYNYSFVCRAYFLYRRDRSENTIDIAVILVSEFVDDNKEKDIKLLRDHFLGSYRTGKKGELKRIHTDRQHQMFVNFPENQSSRISFNVDQTQLDSDGYKINEVQISLETPANGCIQINEAIEQTLPLWKWTMSEIRQVTEEEENDVSNSVQCSSTDASVEVLAVYRNRKLTNGEISRLSRKCGWHWDCLAGLLDIPYYDREEIRFNFTKFSSKAEQVLLLYHDSQSFDRHILKKCFNELGRKDLKSAMLPMENEDDIEDMETGSLQAPVSENEQLVNTPLSSRELYRLSRRIVVDWETLAGSLEIPGEDRNIIRTSDKHNDDRSRAEKMLSIFNRTDYFSRETLARALKEIGQLELVDPMKRGKRRSL